MVPVPGMTLPCVNCKQEVSSGDAKMFAETYVCPTCFKIAERLMQRSFHEANQMLLVLKEGIRLGLIKGELQFSTEEVEDMDPSDLFQELSKLTAEAKKERKQWQPPSTTPLKESTSLVATAQDAHGRQKSS